MSESARQISLGYQPHLPARRMLNFRSIGSAIPSNPVAGTTDTVHARGTDQWFDLPLDRARTDRQPV